MLTSVEYIRYLMKIENVNQSELARRLGCSRQLVSQNLINGYQLSFDNFTKYVDALGYNLAFVPKED